MILVRISSRARLRSCMTLFFFFQAEDGIRDGHVTGVQTCALPICACVLCYAGTSAERAQETLDVTLGELQRLAKGIEAEELARLKARVKSSLIMQGESSSARSGALARDWYHLGRPRTLQELGELVDAL